MKISRTFPFARIWLAAAGCCMAALFLIEACTNVSAPAAASHGPFKDYNPAYKPPPDQYNGTLFKLSQDYPTQMPGRDKLPSFFKIDFQKDWRNYMMAVRDYCFEGNIQVDWRVENNSVRQWYHMPWQDYGRTGREAIHGLTQEAPLSPGQLAATQTDKAVAHAIGFYNEFGGYTIGQVWKDPTNPDPGVTSKEGFLIGTVVCKLLFVDLSPDLIEKEIPYLDNPIEWQAYTAVGFNPPPENAMHTPVPEQPRRVKELTLIQMDIMIRDDRAPSGWIFGTFQYNGKLTKDSPTFQYNAKLANPTPWHNLVPVGLLWGNDPDYAENIQNIPVVDSAGNFPPVQYAAQTPINTGLKETIINPDAELPPTHLGWEGRLNGPVDNPRSSCMSCHMTASYLGQDLSPLFVDEKLRPSPDSPDWDSWWMQWFQNVGWKNGKLDKFVLQPFTKQPLPQLKDSLDFSLQLSAALQNFHQSGTVHPAVTPENPVVR